MTSITSALYVSYSAENMDWLLEAANGYHFNEENNLEIIGRRLVGLNATNTMRKTFA